MKKNLLILMTLITTVIGFSQTTFTVNNITYTRTTTVPPHKVDVTGYNGVGGDVIIPDIVPFNSIDYAVTAIGQYAFQNKSLTSISIPNGIINIAVGAFQTNSLQNVIIPNNVLDIGPLAFSSNQLTNVTIGNSVTSLGVGAFQGNQITNVTLPNSINYISNNAFFNNQISSITIPQNVIIIGTRAFVNNPLTTVITEATSPPSVTYDNVGTSDTFAYNRSNVNLVIPDGTTAAYNIYTWSGFNSVTEIGALSSSNFELDNNVILTSTSNGVKINYSNNIQLQEYEVYTISGVQVTSGKENEITTEDLSSGIYILKCSFDKGNFVKKFVVN